MNKYTEEFVKKLDEIEIPYDIIDEDEDFDWVIFSQTGKHSNNINIHFCIENEGFVQISQFNICEFDREKEAEILNEINKINTDYKFINIYISPKDGISANIDFFADETNVGEQFINMASIFIDLIDTAYPRIMTKVWEV